MAEASGQSPTVHGDERVYWPWGDVKIDSSFARPGGTATVRLPEDPEHAAKVVKTILQSLSNGNVT